MYFVGTEFNSGPWSAASGEIVANGGSGGGMVASIATDVHTLALCPLRTREGYWTVVGSRVGRRGGCGAGRPRTGAAVVVAEWRDGLRDGTSAGRGEKGGRDAKRRKKKSRRSEEEEDFHHREDKDNPKRRISKCLQEKGGVSWVLSPLVYAAN